MHTSEDWLTGLDAETQAKAKRMVALMEALGAEAAEGWWATSVGVFRGRTQELALERSERFAPTQTGLVER
jgi:hypothetical protein